MKEEAYGFFFLESITHRPVRLGQDSILRNIGFDDFDGSVIARAETQKLRTFSAGSTTILVRLKRHRWRLGGCGR